MPASNQVNVLYISYDGMTDPLGQSQVIPYLEGLAKLDYNFTLMSFEKPERYAKAGNEVAERLKQNNIDWVPLTYTKKPPILSTVYDLWCMTNAAFALHRQKKFSIVHCRSYISSLAGMRMKKKFGVKFIFDMRGFYADERVDGGLWKLDNPVYKWVYNFFKQKEKEFLANADYTVSLTHAGKREILTWKEIPHQPVPIQVIPCCADLDKFSPNKVSAEQLQQLRTKLGIKPDEFVLSYIGSIGTWYLPDEMLDFFKCLLVYRPNARFLFVTTEPAEFILGKARQKGIEKDRFIITPCAHNLMPAHLALSNASIFFIKPVFSKKASSPTKQGEIMGMGIPEVCNTDVGDIEEITDAKTGVLIRHFTSENYKKAIEQLLNTHYDSQYIQNRAQQVYSLFAGVEKYRQIYAHLLNTRN